MQLLCLERMAGKEAGRGVIEAALDNTGYGQPKLHRQECPGKSRNQEGVSCRVGAIISGVG